MRGMMKKDGATIVEDKTKKGLQKKWITMRKNQEI